MHPLHSRRLFAWTSNSGSINAWISRLEFVWPLGEAFQPWQWFFYLLNVGPEFIPLKFNIYIYSHIAPNKGPSQKESNSSKHHLCQHTTGTPNPPRSSRIFKMPQIQVCNPLHLIPLPDNMAVSCLVVTFQKVFRWLPPYLNSFLYWEKTHFFSGTTIWTYLNCGHPTLSQ